MGLFGAIGSFICSCASGIVSGITSIARGVASFAKSAVSVIGSAIGSKAAAFMGLVSSIASGPLGPILGPLIEQLIVIAVEKVIEILAKEMGIIGEEDKTEELGYRIEEAENHPEWKQRESFASTEEYYAYLGEQVPAESINYKLMRDKKPYYAMLGMMAEVKALEEKLRVELPAEFLLEAGKSRMTPEEIRAFADAFRYLGYDSVQAQDYFRGVMAPGEAKRITEAIISALRSYFPEKSEDELYARLGDMQAAARDDNKLPIVYNDDLADIENTRCLPEW